ncbi:MAG: dTMP kinase [Candidatus Omnitrophota bacterium]
MAKKIKKGLFLTFEGPEGSGKSTHSARLTEDLRADGFDVIHTAEPGGTALGDRIRDILLVRDEISLGKNAELFLFEADRAQHVEELIRPAVESGKIVICDRFNTATFAYQGYGLGMDMGLIRMIDSAATGGLSPDMTLLLDVDIATGLSRACSEHAADRMEKRNVEFHKRVRAGYLSLAKIFPDRIKVVQVTGDIEETYCIVKEKIYGFIAGYKRAGHGG